MWFIISLHLAAVLFLALVALCSVIADQTPGNRISRSVFVYLGLVGFGYFAINTFVIIEGFGTSSMLHDEISSVRRTLEEQELEIKALRNALDQTEAGFSAEAQVPIMESVRSVDYSPD